MVYFSTDLWYTKCNYTLRGGLPVPGIIKISVGDTLELKKAHPCGGKLFEVMRTGSDVRIICKTCGRDMTQPRDKLERAIKK